MSQDVKRWTAVKIAFMCEKLGGFRPDAEFIQAPEHDRIVAELKAENEILKSKASQFESTLKETMRVRDAEIEKLKRVVDVLKIQRCRLLSKKFQSQWSRSQCQRPKSLTYSGSSTHSISLRSCQRASK